MSQIGTSTSSLPSQIQGYLSGISGSQNSNAENFAGALGLIDALQAQQGDEGNEAQQITSGLNSLIQNGEAHASQASQTAGEQESAAYYNFPR